jgi:hypothetical protein
MLLMCAVSSSTTTRTAPFTSRIPSGEIDAKSYSNIVVLSDIHGDDMAFIRSIWISLQKSVPPKIVQFEALYQMFEEAIAGTFPVEPIDPNSGTLMIQMGDLVDRGKYGKKCIQFLNVTERLIGWKTLSLYGNHDLYSLLSSPYDMLHPEEDIDRENDFTRETGILWKAIVDKSLLMIRTNSPPGVPLDHPNDASILFVHAGIDYRWFSMLMAKAELVDVNEFNLATEKAMHSKSFERIEQIFGDERSPLITRDLSTAHESAICTDLPKLLQKFQVSRLIVGHTPLVSRRVMSKCDGKLILTDVMMSRWMTNLTHAESDLESGAPHAIMMSLNNGLLESIVAYYTGSVGSEVITEQMIFPVVVATPSPKPLVPNRKRSAKTEEDKENIENFVEERKRNRSSSPRDVVHREDGVLIYGPRRRDSGCGFFMRYANDAVQYDLEYIEGEMILEDGSFHYGIPVIEHLEKHSEFYFEAFLKLEPSHGPKNVDWVPLMQLYDGMFGNHLANQIFEITEYFHSFNVCIGYEPIPAEIQDGPWVWIRTFFAADPTGNQLKLINLTRLRRGCEDIDDELSLVERTFAHELLDFDGDEEDEDEDDPEEEDEPSDEQKQSHLPMH